VSYEVIPNEKLNFCQSIFSDPSNVFLCFAGTFLVVYICISLVFGIPLVFLEIGLGQFCQEGTTKLWRAVPLFKGKTHDYTGYD
jgi:hypothetical protein